MELLALFHILWKRKWVIIAFTILLPLLALITCLNMTKVYETVAKVNILEFEDQTLLQRQIPENWSRLSDLTGTLASFSQAEIIRSRMVIDPVIKKLHLTKRITMIDKLTMALGLNEEPEEEYIRLEKLVEPGFIGAFLQRRQIYIEPMEDADIIEIYAYSDVMEEARDIANEVASSYVTQAGLLKQKKARQALAIINNSLEASRQDLKSAQNSFKIFQEEHSVINIEKRVTDIQENLNDLENQYKATTNDLQIRKNTLRELNQTQLPTEKLYATLKSIENFNRVQDQLTMLITQQSTLSGMLTDKRAAHPEVVEKQAQVDKMRQEIVAEISRLISSEITELSITKSLLTKNIASTKSELEHLAETNRLFIDLQREVTLADTNYQTLITTRESAMAAAATDYSNATIITTAVFPDPRDPFYPEPVLYIIIAGIVGLMFGFGMAFVVEFMDLSVKSLGDIEKACRIRILGGIPKPRSRLLSLLQKTPPTDSTEGAIIEASHNLTRIADRHTIVALTSILNAEGKTMIAVKLAQSLAAQNYKVALVDLNFSAPALHKKFSKAQQPGITDLFQDKNMFSSLLEKGSTKIPNLFLFPSGEGTERAIHQLNAEPLQQFLNKLASQVDYVLLDSAALCMHTGGAIVTSLAHNTILIVSVEGPTPQRLAEGINTVKNSGGSIQGIIANRV